MKNKGIVNYNFDIEIEHLIYCKASEIKSNSSKYRKKDVIHYKTYEE